MTDPARPLDRVRVLILEDDFYLATDLQSVLETAGAVVTGPFSDEAQACRAIEDEVPDCAFIDVNLGQGPSFTVARELMHRSVPFTFLTGYDADTLPPQFQEVSRLNKPVGYPKVLSIALQLLSAGNPLTGSR